jgi:hypothetical protein
MVNMGNNREITDMAEISHDIRHTTSAAGAR